MSYIHSGAVFYTQAAIIIFTNNCNAGKLNKHTYVDEPNHIILEKINLRRKESLAVVESSMAKIMEGFRRPEEPVASTVEWERRVKGKVEESDGKLADLQQESNAELADLRKRVVESDGKLADLQQASNAELADLRKRVVESNAEVVNLRKRVVETGGKLTDLQQRLDASDAELADLRKRVVESDAELADLRRGASEVDEPPRASDYKEQTIIEALEAKTCKLEQALNATGSFIEDLQQAIFTSAEVEERCAKHAFDMEHMLVASEEIQRVTDCLLEEFRKTFIAWRTCALDSFKILKGKYAKAKRAGDVTVSEEVKLKAAAWDAQVDRIVSKQIEAAVISLGPKGKLLGLAEAVGVMLLPSDGCGVIKEKILLATHADKPQQDLQKKELFRRVHQLVLGMKA